MAELTINIRFERGDDIYDIDTEAYNGDDDIQSELEFDKQFQDLLNALGYRFVEIVDKLNADDANLK